MDRRLFASAVGLLLLGAAIGSASAQDIFPEVTMSFDSFTSTYTYHVFVPQYNTYPFGQLLIFAHASSWNGYEETWTIGGPIVGGQNMDWLAGFSAGDPGEDTCEWRALNGQEVTFGPWEGDFIIVAPDTTPVAGQGMTKDGVEGDHLFDIDVPGNIIPEPSSLVALGSMIALAGGLIRRRR
jgi:hypothetical protein